ncbi:hypothetical protein [Streptomyces pinistramenti]|uniref:hypothetical protein n=1 Tax=Streptomyces pinistramenti TaxID=2884812 RepID=UPI001D07AEA8|nr:hypothetical protein [Streptomyces pinistramenti]MCB5905910.1 hypothetical protein [Streptomyces pinistramenti]
MKIFVKVMVWIALPVFLLAAFGYAKGVQVTCDGKAMHPGQECVDAGQFGIPGPDADRRSYEDVKRGEEKAQQIAGFVTAASGAVFLVCATGMLIARRRDDDDEAHHALAVTGRWAILALAVGVVCVVMAASGGGDSSASGPRGRPASPAPGASTAPAASA